MGQPRKVAMWDFVEDDPGGDDDGEGITDSLVSLDRLIGGRE